MADDKELKSKGKNKKTKNEKSFRKIKRNHSWISILIFAVMLVLAGALGYAFVDFFFLYAVETKIAAEYDSISYMSRLYDNHKSDNYDLLDEEGRLYFIKDKDGNIIYQKGEITASEEAKSVLFDFEENKINVYLDKNDEYIYVNNEGNLLFDYFKFIKSIRYDKDGVLYVGDRTIEHDELVEYGDKIGIDSNEIDVHVGIDDERYKESMNAINDVVSAELPLWISIDLRDGNELVAKAYVRINVRDVALFTILAIVVAVIIFLVFIVVVANVIGGFIRQRRITNFFFTDQVTKGRNWMWFKDRSDQLLRKKKNAKNKYAVINLVFVKYRTFCLCHSVTEGEEVLKKVNDRMESSIEKKELVAHVTNSNFAMLLRYVDADDLDIRIKTLIKELEQIDTEHKFAFQAGVNKIDVSKDENGRFVKRKNIDIEQEYNNACAARATFGTSEDSGVAYFDEKLVEEQKWIDMVQEKQQQALDNEEFMVYYQPKYDPKTNELRGAEALIRWQSPDYGFVSPGRIIPIFEKNGFITEIDHYMIQHVAEDQKAWLDKGFKCVPVSVNVSRAHFIESDLAEQIRDMIDKVGTPHNLIEIELTESAFFDDKNAMISTIEKLKSYGFSVSMDDFGSGYSSLNSLKDMPLDVLKLDAEFFRGENSGERGEIVVTEAIKLAKSLNMRTVAEGVEIKEQVDFLAEQGCDMIQGYYFAKPMPKDEYEARMSET